MACIGLSRGYPQYQFGIMACTLIRRVLIHAACRWPSSTLPLCEMMVYFISSKKPIRQDFQRNTTVFIRDSVLWMKLPSTIVILGTIRPKYAEGHGVSALNYPVQVSGCLGTPGGKSPRHAQNPLSITPHSLSPHPRVIACTSLISSTDCTVFNLLQSHLDGRSGRKVKLSIILLLLLLWWLNTN